MAYRLGSNYHTVPFKPFRALFCLLLYVDLLSSPESLLYASECLEMQHESKPLSHFVAPSNSAILAFNCLYINLFDATFAFRPIHIMFCPPYILNIAFIFVVSFIS